MIEDLRWTSTARECFHGVHSVLLSGLLHRVLCFLRFCIAIRAQARPGGRSLIRLYIRGSAERPRSIVRLQKSNNTDLTLSLDPHPPTPVAILLYSSLLFHTPPTWSSIGHRSADNTASVLSSKNPRLRSTAHVLIQHMPFSLIRIAITIPMMPLPSPFPIFFGPRSKAPSAASRIRAKVESRGASDT